MYPTMSDRRYSPMRYQRGSGRLLRLLVWILLIFYVIKNPAEAAANAKGILGWLQAGAESFFSFVHEVGQA